jgi:hypothetical protein
MLEKLGSDLVRGIGEMELPDVKVDLAGCFHDIFFNAASSLRNLSAI